MIAYSQALNIPAESLYGPPDDPLRLAHEWLVAEKPVSFGSGAGRRVGVSLARRLERRVVELRHLDDVVGGDDLFPLVQRERAEVRRVVDEASCSAAVRRQLLVVLGELAQLAGWVCSDAGNHSHAQHLYLSGFAAARAAENRELAGQLLSSLSYQWANSGNPADAALLAKSAVRGLSESAPPLVRALLTERVAWAAAKSRDHSTTRRVLDEVDELYENRSSGGEPEPEWVYWLDRREIDVMAGRCHIELGDPGSAAPLLTSAIDDYAPDHLREAALYRTWLVAAYANSGDLDAARRTLTTTRRIAADVSSTRLDHRIAEVGRLVR